MLVVAATASLLFENGAVIFWGGRFLHCRWPKMTKRRRKVEGFEQFVEGNHQDGSDDLQKTHIVLLVGRSV